MLQFERLDLFLGAFCDHAFAVQLPVRAGVRLIAGRQKIGRNIAFASDIGDHFDLVLDIRKLGEKFRLGVAFKDLSGDGIASVQRFLQAICVGLVKENLRLQHVRSLLVDRRVVAKREVEQNLDRGAALHV